LCPSTSTGPVQPFGLSDHHEGQLFGIEAVARHAIDLLQRHGLDHVVAVGDVIDRQAVHLHADGNPRNLAVALEPKRIRAGQIGLGIAQFLGADAIVADARPFVANDADRFGDTIIGRGHRPDPKLCGVLVGQIGIDPVGQPALFAHLGDQTAFKAATAQNVVQDIGREEIGIIAINAGLAEHGNRLRCFKVHNFDAAGKVYICRAGQRCASCRQIPKKIVQEAFQLICGNVTDRADENPILGQRGVMRFDQIIAGQIGDAIKRTSERRGIGVIPIDQRVKGHARQITWVLKVGADVRFNLCADPVNGLLVKPGVHNAFAQ